MKWGILLVTTGDREQGMLAALDSVTKIHPQAGVTAVLQGYSSDSLVYQHPQIANVLSYPDGIGPHSARVAALPGMLDSGLDAIVNMDDDMELIPETDLRPSVFRSLVKGVGLVTNNSRRWAKLVPKVIRRHEFIDDPIVETGGGIAYSASTAEIILDGPDLDYLYDDSEWSLRAYLAGLVNQRYFGSLAIHATRTPGGRLGWIPKKKRAFCDEKYLKPRPRPVIGVEGAENSYDVYIKVDLKPLAHQVHQEKRANLQ